MLELTSTERRALRARAHALNPIVLIGENGLSDNVLREIASSLDAHELIKVRTLASDRAVRAALLDEICDKLDAAPVQHIGKILVIYRPAPEEPTPAVPPRRRKPGKAKRTKRDFQAG